MSKIILKPHQVEAIKKALAITNTLFCIKVGKGKCVGLGTKILMYDGSIKNVEDIIVGDQLMGDDSTPRNVLSLARGRDQMYRVIPNKGGDPFTCNSEHILSLKCSYNKSKKNVSYIKDEVINISVKDYLHKDNFFKEVMKLYKVPVEFNNVDRLEIDPYIYGLWIGDGTTVYAELTTIDKEISNIWAKYGKELGLLTSTHIQKGTEAKRYRYVRENKLKKNNIFLDFIRTSVVNGEKRIKKEYLTSNRENRLKLLAGIIDTDGCLGNKEGSYLKITTKLKGLAEDYAYLARSLGFRASLKKKDRFVKYLNKNYISYDVNISGSIERIPVVLNRRKCGELNPRVDYLRTGFKVEFLGEGDYYGFELDDNHLYLLGDFTVTHNTFASLFLSRILLKNKDIDKIIFCITSSGVGTFINEFKNVGVDVKLVEDFDDLIKFLASKEKFILIKHSFMENLGKDKSHEDELEKFLTEDYKKIMLVIDEAHKISNPDSWANTGVDHTRRFYEKILLLTATPYSSKLDQIYGLVKLIYPKKWKTLKEFRDKYVRSEIIRDWKTGKFIRPEDIEYINLPELRNELEEFTYFYYPPTKLNYYEHKIKLSEENYKIYTSMCQEIYQEMKDRNKKEKDD